MREDQGLALHLPASSHQRPPGPLTTTFGHSHKGEGILHKARACGSLLTVNSVLKNWLSTVGTS